MQQCGMGAQALSCEQVQQYCPGHMLPKELLDLMVTAFRKGE
jgi:hypothetical protein